MSLLGLVMTKNIWQDKVTIKGNDKKLANWIFV
jgi:hypothetical protein